MVFSFRVQIAYLIVLIQVPNVAIRIYVECIKVLCGFLCFRCHIQLSVFFMEQIVVTAFEGICSIGIDRHRPLSTGGNITGIGEFTRVCNTVIGDVSGCNGNALSGRLYIFSIKIS